MHKKITPRDLARIVAALLISPSIFKDELSTAHEHQAFMLEIGKVVADFCGGDIAGITPTDNLFLNPPTLRVEPNELLNSYHRNVWAYFDNAVWDSHRADITPGEPISEEETLRVIDQINDLFTAHADSSGQEENVGAVSANQHLERTLVDCDIMSGVDENTYRMQVEQEYDSKDIRVKIHQVSLDDENVFPKVGLAVRIGLAGGMPAVSLGLHEDNFKIHVLSDEFSGIFINCEPDISPKYQRFQLKNGQRIDGEYYPCSVTGLLNKARKQVADKLFKAHSFPAEFKLKSISDWAEDEHLWYKDVQIENTYSGGHIARRFIVEFEKNNIKFRSAKMVELVSHLA